jgi:hypothetical protein
MKRRSDAAAWLDVSKPIPKTKISAAYIEKNYMNFLQRHRARPPLNEAEVLRLFNIVKAEYQAKKEAENGKAG